MMAAADCEPTTVPDRLEAVAEILARGVLRLKTRCDSGETHAVEESGDSSQKCLEDRGKTSPTVSTG
jgi:hypothetical protein